MAWPRRAAWRSAPLLLILAATASAGTAPDPPANAPPADRVAVATTNLRDCSLPEDHPLLPADDEALAGALLDLRDAEPDLFAATAGPPEGSRQVPDFAPMEELLLVYPGWDDHDATFATLLQHATRHGRVRVIPLTPYAVAHLGRLLASLSVDRARVRVDSSLPAESIWVRDWGPQPLTGPSGESWLDTRYSPDCYDNDALPTRLAWQLGGLRLDRTDLYVDGGNLVADHTGRCYTTTSLAESNHLDVDQLASCLRGEAGCVDVVVLEPLTGNVIDHVDMLLAPAPGGELLLAAFDPAEDPANAAVMARNRVVLERLPRPDGTLPGLIDIPSPTPAWSLDGPLVRTWVNLLPFNGVVFVPGYADAQPNRQAVALSAVETAYPGRQAVLVPSDPLVQEYGGVRCLGRAWADPRNSR